MHQCLVHWVGDKIEIVPRDSSYVIASAESDTYERTRCISGEVWEKDFLKVADPGPKMLTPSIRQIILLSHLRSQTFLNDQLCSKKYNIYNIIHN
jgi:hypothetical protein